jgi:hypothetical protein
MNLSKGFAIQDIQRAVSNYGLWWVIIEAIRSVGR